MYEEDDRVLVHIHEFKYTASHKVYRLANIVAVLDTVPVTYKIAEYNFMVRSMTRVIDAHDIIMKVDVRTLEEAMKKYPEGFL